MTDHALELRNVHVRYESVEVLHGVDLAVPRGRVLALLGANGAGKSTLLKVVAGLHPIHSGEIRVDGRRVDGQAADRLARRGICLVPERRAVFPNLTVREHLLLASHLGVSRRDAEAAAFERFPRLAERRKQEAGTLSGGEQQMLALARAMVTRPGLLLVDELSMGLAPNLVESLYETVRSIAAEGVTVVVVEQFAHAVLDVADRAAVMVSGRIAHVGAPAEIEARLSGAYLGAAR